MEYLLLLLGVGVVAGGALFMVARSKPKSQPSQPAVPTSPPSRPASSALGSTAPVKMPIPAPTRPLWKFTSEEHWVAAQVIQDIAEQLAFAAAGRDGQVAVTVKQVDLKTRHYSVVVTPVQPGLQPISTPVTLSGYIWNPAAYLPFAAYLIQSWKIQPETISNGLGIDPLELLLSPVPEAIEPVQTEISSALTAHPTAPDLHEQAAWTLIVWGMFQCAGIFQDLRFLICRATSHLVISQALCQATATVSGGTGNLAVVGLLSLVGRTAEAVDQIAVLHHQSPPALISLWLKILYVVTTGDWRYIPTATGVSVAEALAGFQARCALLPVREALDWIETRQEKVYPAFVARCLFQKGVSVSMGHKVIKSILTDEMQDITTLFRPALRHAQSGHEAIIKLLNTHPTRALNLVKSRIEVISPGLWAHHFQANLLFDMLKTINFNEYTYGNPEATQRYLQTIEASFSGLEQFPILLKHCAKIKEPAPQIFAKIIQLVQTNPEFISAGNFVSLRTLNQPGATTPPIPQYQDWLSVPFLFGTTQGDEARAVNMKELDTLPMEDAFAWCDLNPFSLFLVRNVLILNGDDLAPREIVERVYARLKDFAELRYLRVLVRILAQDPVEQIRILRRVAELDPNSYFQLGERLLQQGQPEEAAAIYLKGIEVCKDRVLVSNSVRWLVRYLMQIGKFDQAQAIANDAAEVYSGEGLLTKVYWLEMQGRLDEAESYLLKVEERYNTAIPLAGFYIRNSKKNPRYAAEVAQGMPNLFPQGIRKFVPPPSGSPPRSGVKFRKYCYQMGEHGIQKDAIIVAVNGNLVENLGQYKFLILSTLDPQLTLTTYQNGQYQTIQNYFIGQVLGGADQIQTFQPSA